MKRLARFLKITGIDTLKTVGIAAAVIACLAVVVGIGFGILYCVGILTNDVIFGDGTLSTKQYIEVGMAFSVLVGLPCFLLFISFKVIIFICRWIASSWRRSGVWR